MVRSSPVQDVTDTIDGVTYTGRFYTHGPTVFVQYMGKKKQTLIGGSPPESIARMLLSEMVRGIWP
jgi:hypothetical protein